MELPGVKNLPIANSRVLLRTDYDVPLVELGSKRAGEREWVVEDETRIEDSLPTINYLLSQKAKVIIVSHLGRPGGKVIPGLSLTPVYRSLVKKLPEIKVGFYPEIVGKQTIQMVANLKPGEILLLENLRFDPGEESNSFQFAERLAQLAEAYVNDAFAVSHRAHASLVRLSVFLPSAFGFDFLEEVDVLGKVWENPQRPVVVLLGGVKESKIESAKKLASWADYILVGGKLTEYDGIPQLVDHQKVLGSLTKTGEDITIETVEQFKKIIAKAKTVVWSGPMGAFEEEKFETGTREIAQAIVDSGAYSIVGGGNTEAALTKFGLAEKISYVSSGGGAMLAFLAEGTLPGIEAIVKTKKTKELKV